MHSTHILRHPNYQIVFISRRNILKAVVSVLLSEQTQLWHAWDQKQPIEDYYRTLEPLNVDDLHSRVAELRRHFDEMEAVLDSRPVGTAVKLIYEDLYFAPEASKHAQIARIWGMLA